MPAKHRKSSPQPSAAAGATATTRPSSTSVRQVARDLLLLAVVTLACLAPFLNKAAHIDDPLFIWAAQQIQRQPWDFYGFDVNWGLTATPMHQETKNPPLVCYYLAVVGGLCGWSEPILHAALLLPAVLAVWGTYALARTCGAPPIWTALATLATPVYLVSASTLMCDIWMLAFWLAAMTLWLHGLEAGSRTSLVAAAVAVGMAIWSKYFAVTLIPLLAVYTVRCRGWRSAAVAWLLIPSAMFIGYELLSYQLYGAGMFGQAIRYALHFGSWSGEMDAMVAGESDDTSLVERAWVGLVFGGGCCLPLVAHFALWWRRNAWLAIGLFLALAAIVLWGVDEVARYQMRPAGKTDLTMLAHQVIFGAAGAALTAHAAWSMWHRRDAVTILLAVWLLGTLVFAGVVNWTCNGRSILPLVPAAAILALRDARLPFSSRWEIWLRPAFVAAGLALSLLVTHGEAEFANSDREMAHALLTDYPPSKAQTVWFQGHWGWQYYLQAGGAQPIDFKHTVVSPTDVILLTLDNTSVFELGTAVTQVVEERTSPQSRFVGTMCEPRGAAFHASKQGPLPFRLGSTPPHHYQVSRTRKPLTIKAE